MNIFVHGHVTGCFFDSGVEEGLLTAVNYAFLLCYQKKHGKPTNCKLLCDHVE